MWKAFERMDRAELYAKGGVILANTGFEIGLDISDTTRDSWAKRMTLLSNADDISENNPGYFTHPATLLDHLQIPDEPEVRETAHDLLQANNAAFSSTTIREHYRQRATEACASFDLIAYGHDKERYAYALNQLSRLSVAGIMLDSAVDALDDAKKLSQFTARELASGGLRRFAKIARTIDRNTWQAFTKASFQENAAQYFLKKPLRIFANK